MRYEINISRHGEHFFATAERSIQTRYDLEPVLTAICEKFPKDEGYLISVSHIETTGREIHFSYTKKFGLNLPK